MEKLSEYSFKHSRFLAGIFGLKSMDALIDEMMKKYGKMEKIDF